MRSERAVSRKYASAKNMTRSTRLGSNANAAPEWMTSLPRMEANVHNAAQHRTTTPACSALTQSRSTTSRRALVTSAQGVAIHPHSGQTRSTARELYPHCPLARPGGRGRLFRRRISARTLRPRDREASRRTRPVKPGIPKQGRFLTQTIDYRRIAAATRNVCARPGARCGTPRRQGSSVGGRLVLACTPLSTARACAASISAERTHPQLNTLPPAPLARFPQHLPRA